MNLFPGASRPVRFGEEYHGRQVTRALAKDTGELVRVVNPQTMGGDMVPLMTELRPAQAAQVSAINDNLEALNTTLQQGFAQLNETLRRRFPNL